MATSSPAPDLTAASDLLDLRGRTAIVTGGAMGIGWGIARRLHEANARVVIADLDLTAAQQAAANLEARRPRSARAIAADVGDPTSVQALVAEAVDSFGSVDILVNNAGIYPLAPLADLDLATFRRVLDTNLLGTFLCTKAASARMIEQGRGGRIINITSYAALHASLVGLAHYDASKHGVWGFTMNVALELAPHRIWVNAVAPGAVRTPGIGDRDANSTSGFEAAIPMRRLGEPDDIGRAALFLACDLSSYMTGTQILVDGGRLLA